MWVVRQKWSKYWSPEMTRFLGSFIRNNTILPGNIYEILGFFIWLISTRIKVARVVNFKLAFKDWLFYNLIILIKLCKIWYLNLVKTLLFPRNQVIFLKNWKLWRAPTTIEVFFFLKFCASFLLNNVYKRVFGIFFHFV